MKVQAAVPTEVAIDPKEILRNAARLVLAYQGLDYMACRLVPSTDPGITGPTVEIIDREAMRARGGRLGEPIWTALRYATPEDEQAFLQFHTLMEMCLPENVERLARAQWVVEQRRQHSEWRERMRKGQE